jgi:AraC family transcriptional regulator
MVTKLAPGAFFGRTHRCRQIGPITLIESLYGPEVILPPHTHVAAYFDYILEGACSELVHGRTRDRGRWSLAFHPEGELHSNRWGEGAGRTFQIELGPTLLDRVRAGSPDLGCSVHFAAGPARWMVQRVYDEFGCTDEVSALAVEGLTLELLAEGLRRGSGPPEPTPPRWVRQVRDLLHEEFRRRLTLEEIACSVGVHPAHLARAFRRYHRCTVSDYVRNLRIEYACHRLRTSNASLATIALEAGFSDQSHFSRVFKRHTGTSPAIFRQCVPPPSRNTHATECSDRTRK